MPRPPRRCALDPVTARLRPRVSEIGLVIAGGAVGTAARALLSAAIPDLGGIPFGILVINLAGAYLLGLLLELLTRRGLDDGLLRRIRLGAGTGLIGGFTTYSTLAVGTALLLDRNQTTLAALYSLTTVVAGAISTLLGILTARAATPTRDRQA